MDLHPTNAQEKFMALKYGLFLHFGPNTLERKAWGDGRFLPQNFVFEKLDISQWAQTAKEAGMKYAVLTTKHHDGFCLWNSSYTDYCVKNSPGSPDIMKMFVEEFRKVGIKTGIYYSLWDTNFPQYEDDELYAKYMKNQLAELFSNYGEIVSIFFDGLWDKDHPTRKWTYDTKWESDPTSGLGHGERWHWNELYELIHNLQPNCIVMNNSCSDRPGLVKYHPVDCRTAERFDFVYNDTLFIPHYDPIFINDEGKQVYLPLEFCTTLTPDWFYGSECVFLDSVDAICSWHRRAMEQNANLLLNVGPNMDGLIPDYNVLYLREVAKKLGL
jgi:alpha-L-fucosidase